MDTVEPRLIAGIMLTKKEIAELLGCTRQAVVKRSAREVWATTTDQGNGGKIGKHPLHALPYKIQNLWLEKHREEHTYNTNSTVTNPENLPVPVPAALPPALKKQSKIVDLQEIINPNGSGSDLTAMTPVAAWQSLPESSRDKSYDILSIINKVRDIQATTPKNKITPALTAYAASVGFHYRSLYRLLGRADKAMKAAQKKGEDTIMAQIAALTPKWGRNKDKVRAFDKNAVIYAFSLHTTGQMRNMRDTYEQTIAYAAGKNWQVGTYASLCNYLKRLDPATTTLAREGQKRFDADHINKILRNYEEIPPNFMWCGDHHIFDVFVKLPDGKGGWQYKRPWLTSWLDMRSRSLMGWCISFAPNSRTIAMALAHAISPKDDPAYLQCGIPSSVYIDNGKDYRAKYLNGEEIVIGKIDYPDIIERFAALGIDPYYIDLEFDPEQNAWVKKHGDKFIEIKGVRVGGVYARLGIGQRYATAYHPWAKPIERFHRTLVQSFSRDLPGWCGSGHEHRPEKLTFELKSGQMILTIEEFCDRFYGWVVNKYHKTPHRGHGMDGRTPDEVFASLMPTPQTCEPQLLDFALLKKESVKIHNWGFNLNGKQFELAVPVNLQGGNILNILIGTWATIFFDYDYKTVRVYKDGVWQCNARLLNRASFVTPNDPVMVDKLKLGAYQKRSSVGTIKMIQDHPAAQEEANEAAALLAITQINGDTLLQGVPIYPLPSDETAVEKDKEGAAAEARTDTPGGGSRGTPAAPSFPMTNADPLDEAIFITPNERYRGQILKKIAYGCELTPAQQTFRETFEQSQTYLDSKPLYDAQLDYEIYLAGGKG